MEVHVFPICLLKERSNVSVTCAGWPCFVSSSQQDGAQLASPRQLLTPGGLLPFSVLLQLLDSAQNIYCSGKLEDSFEVAWRCWHDS